jgi:DNA replicative helicase MCM subunit Mcm2 (Cdc46/Mcm family)
VNHGFGGISIPRTCDQQKNPGIDKQNCKLDTYAVVTDLCDYIDQQSLKLQEAPELIPTGMRMQANAYASPLFPVSFILRRKSGNNPFEV